MKVVGYANIKPVLTNSTVVGGASKYAGKRLKVLERSSDGDCLVLASDDSGLGSIAAEDIQSYQEIVIPKTGNVLFDQLMQMMAGRI